MPKKKSFEEILRNNDKLEFVLRDPATGEEAVFELDKEAGETSALMIFNTGGNVMVVGRGGPRAQLEAYFSMFETTCRDLKVQPDELIDWTMELYETESIEVQEEGLFEEEKDRRWN